MRVHASSGCCQRKKSQGLQPDPLALKARQAYLGLVTKADRPDHPRAAERFNEDVKNVRHHYYRGLERLRLLARQVIGNEKMD